MNNFANIVISNFDDIKNPYYGGGGATAVHEVAKRLSKKYKITVLTGKYAGSKNETIDNVFYKRIGLSHGNPKFAQLVYQFLLPFYVLTTPFDFWLESFTPPFSTGLLQLFTKKPVIGVTHFLSAEEKSKQYGLPFYLIQNYGLKTYKYIVTMSQDMKDRIRALNSTVNIAIIPNGITPIRYKRRKTKNYMLFVGRLEIEQKGIDLLLDAYKKASSHIRTNLYIAGSGQQKDEQRIQATISRLNLKSRVHLLGRIEGEQKTRILSEAKFVVIPSRYEAFSLMVLESLQCGKPIVSFNISGLKWIDSRVSLKAKPFSVSSLARCIVEMSTNSTIRNTLHIHSLKLSKLYSWPLAAKAYDKFIRSIHI